MMMMIIIIIYLFIYLFIIVDCLFIYLFIYFMFSLIDGSKIISLKRSVKALRFFWEFSKHSPRM